MNHRLEKTMNWSGARWTTGMVLVLASGALAGCDGILEVDLPGQITAEEAFDPSQAEVLVSSAIGDIECAMSDYIAMNGAGNADAFHRTIGWWNGSHEYEPTPDTGSCSSGENDYGWFTPLHAGRWTGEQVYQRLDEEWTVDEVPPRERLMGTAALYIGLTYSHLGEFLCEVSANTGPLMSWEESLVEAESWYTAALAHIDASGDFSIDPGITDSAEQLAYLLRARAKLARGAYAEAALDAEMVEQGFIAYFTREAGGERKRWNRVISSHNDANWSTLVGPITHELWSPEDPTNPVTGLPWPDPIPFTGYWDLAVLPDGRAITADQYPVTLDDAGAVADPRVPAVDLGVIISGSQYPRWQQQKYTSLDDDFPLAKWEEAWLIRAEAALEAGDKDVAIQLVNEARPAALPDVTYIDGTASDQAVRDMIIEEIRRTHFLEGRFWSTKLRHLLWFPRGQGTAVVHNFNQGVRMVMPGGEYELNPNFEQSARGSYCPEFQDPT